MVQHKCMKIEKVFDIQKKNNNYGMKYIPWKMLLKKELFEVVQKEHSFSSITGYNQEYL